MAAPGLWSAAFGSIRTGVEFVVQKAAILAEGARVVIREGGSHTIPTNPSDAASMMNGIEVLLEGSGGRRQGGDLRAMDFLEGNLSIPSCVWLPRSLHDGCRWGYVGGGIMPVVFGSMVSGYDLRVAEDVDEPLVPPPQLFTLHVSPPAPIHLFHLPAGLHIVLAVKKEAVFVHVSNREEA
ncbi:hypothetical protein EJB05_48861 [Eragrostis curvula]|uniref:Uncharacterized protein n=1 Tax=Eragrostis curvula TaxID=38414 RepID=A0A5J9T381_9POAL|nr:hypothetical protein EJB05_48861 [Eragrostis curvula]